MSGLEPPFTHDPAGMAARIEATPDDVERTLSKLANNRWRVPAGTPDLLAVGAMGGSAISADLTAHLWADRMPRPLLAVRDYHWPAMVTPASLALLSSYSGNTEETLALYDEAAARGIPRVAITTGGALAERCARDGVFVVRLEPGSPPRAALFPAWVRLTALVHALGWVDDPEREWREAAERMRAARGRIGIAVPEGANPAKQAAGELNGRFVIVYGSAALGAVATRVRNQINENAKLLGHSAVVPELDHNEIVGWERDSWLAERSAIVLLRDADDSDVVRARLALTAEFAARHGARIVEVEAGKGGRLARAAELVQWGDYVSLYLAMLNGVDPTPIASIDEFKSRLGKQNAR